MTAVKGTNYITNYSGITPRDIASFIGRTLTDSEETLVMTLIENAEDFFAKQTRRQYKEEQEYFDIYDAGKLSYTPTNFPILEVTAISLDGTDIYIKGGASNVIELNKDFFVFDDCVTFETSQSSITNNKNAFKITYKIDNCFRADAKFALSLWISNYFMNRENGGKEVNSRSIAGITEAFTTNVPDYIDNVILNYRKHLL